MVILTILMDAVLPVRLSRLSLARGRLRLVSLRLRSRYQSLIRLRRLKYAILLLLRLLLLRLLKLSLRVMSIGQISSQPPPNLSFLKTNQ